MKKTISVVMTIVLLIMLGFSVAAERERDAGVLRFDGRYCSLIPLDDGGFLAAGLVWLDADSTEAWAARISPEGETLWEVRNDDGETFGSPVALSDGTFMLAMKPKKSDDNSIAVVTLDANGQMLTDPVTLETQGYPYKGKDCMLVRISYDYDPNVRIHPVVMLAVNAKGETLWEHTYDELKGAGFSVYPAADGYLLASNEQDYPFDQTTSTGMMARLNDQGNLLWKKRMEKYPNTMISCSLETADGGMFVAGININAFEVNAEPYENSDFVARFDADGNVMWCHYYLQSAPPTELRFAELMPAPDDGVIVLATGYELEDMNRLRFIHLNKDGKVQDEWWQQIADTRVDLRGTVTVGEQNYVIYFECPVIAYGPGNTCIAPFIWHES